MTPDELAQEIRRVDGGHRLGAGALAEALMPLIASAIREAIEPYESTLSIIDSTLSGIPGESRAEKIANAISNAEGDALERAAKLCEIGVTSYKPLKGGFRRSVSRSPFFAAQIRSLRHPAKGETP